MTQQLQGRLSHFETVGAWMLGADADLYLRLINPWRRTMPLGALQHYTIEPSDLEATKDFYCDVLGLENGDRPPLGFPGYWLYSGGVADRAPAGTAYAARGHRRAWHREEVRRYRPFRPYRLRRQRPARRAQAARDRRR